MLRVEGKMIRVKYAGEETCSNKRVLFGVDSKRVQKCKRFLTEPCLIVKLKSITKSEVVKLLGRVLVQCSCDVKTKGLITCLLLGQF